MLAVLHLASVVVEFRLVAGLYRWLMTYAEGFHRRGLVGTVFQFLVGHQSREAQIELASRISEVGIYLWLVGALGLFVIAGARLRNRKLGWAAVAFAALPSSTRCGRRAPSTTATWTWLVGILVVAALAAFAGKRHVLSGPLAAVGIVGYWGTIFVWLPLGFLTVCLLVRDVTDPDPRERAAVRPMLAASRRREMLPALAALLSALLHDNDAAITELTRIGRQEHIIRETFC